MKLISISLGYSQRPENECYIVSVPTVELEDALLMFMQHNKAPDRAPAGHSLITLYTDTLATPRYLERSDEVAHRVGGRDRRAPLPELSGRRDMSHVTRWPKAGYLTHRFLAALTGPPGSALRDSRIVLAGDLFGAGSMESSARWGERAAELVTQELGARAGVTDADPVI